jgi:surfeit locus 1 family protein
MKRLPIGLTLAMLVSLAILCTLGGWQLQRLAWKTRILAQIEASKSAPVRPLDAVLAGAESFEFRRVVLDCPAQALDRQLELYGLLDGQPGRRLIVACPTASGSILVDQGFVAEGISARPAAGQATVRIEGVLRSPDRPGRFNPAAPQDGLWYGRDIAAMARALDARSPAPVFLFASTSTRPDWKALVPAPVPAEIANRHLEYALTWFGLAGALLAIYAAMLWRRFKAK